MSRIDSGAARHRIWNRAPAGGNWEQAHPIGNGSLGAMVFGGVDRERIQLNEQTIWSRLPIERQNPAAREHVDAVRRLIMTGRPGEAEELADMTMLGLATRVQPYQTMGDLSMRLFGHGESTDYQRALHLDTAGVIVRYAAEGATFERRAFVSAPDDALIVRMTCDQPGRYSGWLDLRRIEAGIPGVVDDRTIDLTGRAGSYGTRFRAALRAIADGGRTLISGDKLRFEGCDGLTLLLTAATDYWGDADYRNTALTKLEATTARTADDVEADHVADHRRWFDRMALDLGGTPDEVAAMPTGARIERMSGGEDDPDLARLAFDMGRYLMIGSSRPGGLPANLQGIWADGLTPAWSSDFHVNINLQMNYWPAEPCNLSELHRPLFDWMQRCCVPDGRKTASIHYGCDGWVMHHNGDPWGYTVPSDGAKWALWPMGGAWLCDHLWEHYLFTGDRDWLGEQAYPILREAAVFFLDYLFEDEQGQLLSGPSMSPENSYRTPEGGVGSLAMGCTMDNQIITELFNHTIEAAALLETDAALRERLAAARDRLPPMRIGRHGQLQEWAEDYEEVEPGHRHVSHLFGLHPGTQIDPWRTPRLAGAARTVLERRQAHGGGHTGWSRAWMISFYARLLDGEEAGKNVRAQLRQCMLSNLLDVHPPYQIDGNFGLTAGIAEMLLQSHADAIVLLPALPGGWPSGSAQGLRARGGVTVDLAWAGGKPTEATLTADRDRAFTVRFPDGAALAEAANASVGSRRDEHGPLVGLTLAAGEPARLRFE